MISYSPVHTGQTWSPRVNQIEHRARLRSRLTPGIAASSPVRPTSPAAPSIATETVAEAVEQPAVVESLVAVTPAAAPTTVTTQVAESQPVEHPQEVAPQAAVVTDAVAAMQSLMDTRGFTAQQQQARAAEVVQYLQTLQVEDDYNACLQSLLSSNAVLYSLVVSQLDQLSQPENPTT